jgi:fructose/tagatose bisphosphate aldolase
MLLSPTQSRELLARAARERFALLAVNADSPAAITDVLEAARICDAPVIIETSLWQLTGHSFGAGDPATGLARYLVQIAQLAASPRFAHLPVLLHTDHIKGPITLPLLKSAIRGLPTGIGDTSISPSTISLDSSALSAADNIAALLELCRESLACGRPATLEMEAGVDDGVTPLELARELVGTVEREAPGFIHLWAPGVGTRHGLGDQKSFSPEAVRAHHELASDIAGRPVGIALHGSSGLDADALRAAVQAGVTKVNWSSESLLIRSQAAREFYRQHEAQLQPGHPDWKNTAMDNGLQQWISERYVPRVVERIRTLRGPNHR